MVDPARDPSSEQFGPYEVQERLGMGGMATVHRAKKRGPAGFERSVALKRMLAHLAEDRNFVESFVREAKVASMLVHPNIAQVYDFGRIGGVYYIAMELVAGFDVRKLLRYANRCNEAIPMPVILSILGELSDALDYAHTFVDETGQQLDIVHRDISPSNMIVAHTGHLKVIDFGIAKAANSRTLHTESGHVKGKLGYMSPEGALGLQIGPVSDVFSVGVVAWELITASPLFSARTDFETMRKIREAPIKPPSLLNPDCPPALDQIVLAALEREPEDRLASARLFRNALDDIAAAAKIQVSPRAVSEWILRFAQPEDVWAVRASAAAPVSSSAPRPRTPSGRVLPLMPPEPPTAMSRIARAPTQLQRAPQDVALATEVWGEDVGTVEEAGPDFHKHVATPLPTQMPSLIEPPPRPATIMGTSRRPLVALLVLSLIAAALLAVLMIKKTMFRPAEASLRFEIEPAGARVTVGEREVGRTSPLDTKLEAGTYELSVTLDGYKPYSRTIDVRAGEAQTIRIALDKEQHEIAIDEPPPAEPAAEPAAEPKPAEKKPAVVRTTTTTRTNKGKRVTKAETKLAEVAPDPEPSKPEPPKPEPPKAEPPKPEPAKPPPPVKAVESKPARTPGVAASAVTKISGEVPTLRAKTAEGSGDVFAKMCIDETGRVSSVKIVKSNPEIASALTSALQSWRYKPYIREGKATAVCFPLSLRVVVKSS